MTALSHPPITRALISVSDKSGLEALATALAARGITMVSTGGTASYLEGLGFDITRVEDVTHFPEMLGGRVKTLHPAVHGGLLAVRSNAAHMQALVAQAIAPIDLLIVNLYPFEATRAQTEDAATLIEKIDVGGPAMIRAAAKNHEAVGVVVDPDDYAEIIAALHAHGGLSAGFRQRLAAKAFARTGAYDSAIASYLCALTEDAAEHFPPYLLDSTRTRVLAYGENPHQQAALYARNEACHGIAHAQLLGGKPLSYNNASDADAAWKLVSQFDVPACAIVKHANPCGVALGTDAADAFTRALSCDPQSAFGGVIAVNRVMDHAFVRALGSLFAEVIVAPDMVIDAVELLRAQKKNLRLLKPALGSSPSAFERWQIKNISGGFLVQTTDGTALQADLWVCATKQVPTEAQRRDLAFAFEVVRSVSSNAIVLAKNGATLGIGAGQMSRVDAVRIAVEHAQRHGHDTTGCVLASDAFFPFADNIALAAQAGIHAVVQPGGSVRDEEVIAACDTSGMAMLLTGSRHFRH